MATSLKSRVYVVDDDESVCRAIKLLLTTFGFDVKTFNSSKSFFENVPPDAPGCLVLDIHMPVLDGWLTQEQIVNAGSTRPIIMISAEKRDNAAERVRKVGAAGFLQKPFDGQVLVNLINQVSINMNILPVQA